MSALRKLFVSEKVADAYRQGRSVGERIGEQRAQAEHPAQRRPYPEALMSAVFDLADAAFPVLGDEAYAVAKAVDAWMTDTETDADSGGSG